MHVYIYCLRMHHIMYCNLIDVKCFGITSWKMSPESTGVFVDGTELLCSFQLSCMILI